MNYKINDITVQNFALYICKANHEASLDSKPGIGQYWNTYWDLMVQGVSSTPTPLAPTAPIIYSINGYTSSNSVISATLEVVVNGVMYGDLVNLYVDSVLYEYGTATTSNITITMGSLVIGEKSITATITRDAVESEQSTAFIFTIVSQDPPTIFSVNGDEESPGSGMDSTLEVVVNDVLEGDYVLLSVDGGGESLAQGTATTSSITLTTNSYGAGEKSITAQTSRNGLLGNESTAFIFTILAPDAPTIYSVDGDTSGTYTGSTTTPDVIVNDVLNGDLVTIYSGNTSVGSDTATTTTITITTSNLSTIVANILTATITRGGVESSKSTSFSYTGPAFTFPLFFPEQGNIKSYYQLENENDSVGGHNLTNTGSVPFVAGKVSNCADLRSASSGINLSVASDLGITGQTISIAFWLKLNSHPSPLGANLAFFNSEHKFGFYSSDGDRYHFYNESVNYIESYADMVMDNDTWYHIAGTINEISGDITLYINGTGYTPVTNNNDIGSFTPGLLLAIGGSNQWEGDCYLDDVIIWDKALTAQQVADLYAGY